MAEIGTERITEVLAEIEAIRRRREELADDDYLGKLDLKERDRELRTELARLRTEVHPELTVEQARAELADIERRLEQIAASRIDVVKQAGGGGQGGDFGFATDALKLNWKIDEAAGRAELEARAHELRSLIADQERR